MAYIVFSISYPYAYHSYVYLHVAKKKKNFFTKWAKAIKLAWSSSHPSRERDYKWKYILFAAPADAGEAEALAQT